MCIDYIHTFKTRKARTVFKLVSITRRGNFISPVGIENRAPQQGYGSSRGTRLRYSLRRKVRSEFSSSGGIYCFDNAKSAFGYLAHRRNIAVLACSVRAGTLIRVETERSLHMLAVEALTPLRVVVRMESPR